MASNESSLWRWLWLPAVTMSLGWALRGFIGGGPLGAMIPGALVALSLAELLDREDAECGLIAAFGAVGMGFGGQETYGQTVGLSFQPETFWWAILGFAIKGAVWGLLGGAVMGLALARERFRAQDVVAGCGLMALGTYVGWKLINEPKLIYFSNRFEKPRDELYAGLLLGALALLVWMAWRGNSKVPLRFASWGALGGGVGFAGGAWIQVIGRSIEPHIWVGWWKVMELTFGACLGLAYGLCAWWNCEALKRTGEHSRCEMRGWLSVALGLAVIAATLVLYEKLPSRLPYTILGAVLLSLALVGEQFAWQIAITMTCCAFFLDLAKAKPQFGAVTLALCVAMGTLAVAVCAAWRPRKRTMLMLLMWSAVFVALFKLFVPPAAKGEGPVVMGGLFVLMASAAWAMVTRVRVAAVCVILLALLLAPTSARGAQPLSGATLEWTLDLGQPTAGGPVQFGRAEAAEGVLIALGSGKVLLISPRGERLASMDLDLMPAGPPVAGIATGAARQIIAADAWGSMYGFDGRGKRLWKHARVEKSGGGFNYPVLADLDGDGVAEAIMTGARGTLYAVDARGKLRLEVFVTNYRVSTPAVGDINGDGRPELVFGSEDNELYALTCRGELLWSRRIEGTRFGRALPLIADIDGDGRYEVLVATPFVGPGPGLYALDGATGKVLWKAPSKMQSYNSTVMADLNGDGRNEILYGDKNTRLFAVDAGGRPLWNKQLDGRGIFFAPAVADLNGDGQATVFQIVRGAGANGKSLYAVNAKGEVVDALAVEGGGGSSPALFRFKGEQALKLLVASASGKLHCYRLPQRAGAAKILWPGVRNDSSNSGFIPSRVATKGAVAPPAKAQPGGAHIGAREVGPDGAIRVRIIPAGMPEQSGFDRAPVRRGAPVAVRQIANPWPTFREAEFRATSRGTTNRVDVSMLGNEYESAAIAVTNLRNDRVTLRLECGAFVSETKKSTPAKHVIEFREAPLILPESTGRPVEDVLPALGEGQLVWLAPKETRKIWLTFRSRDLAEGTHRATLKIGDLLNVDMPHEVPVEVKVHPVRLSDKRVYRHGNWLYLAGIQDLELREAVMKDALEHGTNVFNVPGCSMQVDARGVLGVASTEPHDSLVKKLRGKAFFMIGGSVGLVWPKGVAPDAAVEQRAYAEAIRWYATHMQSLGVGYQEWAFYTMDEPGLMGRDASWERWVEGVKRIKAADPKVQIYANPAGGARAELLGEVSDLVDVWQPDLHQVREQPEELSRIFGKGQYWHYEAPGDQRNLDPLGYYRMKPWVAFQMGMTGGGYWVYQSSSFWFFDRNLPTEYGTVYPTEKGPVTTKRWEASRDGAEDFELLWMVREAARQERGELGREALSLVDQAVRFATKGQEHVSDISRQVRPYTPNFAKWMDYRAKLIDVAARLGKR